MMIYESTVAKAEEFRLEEGDQVTWFTLDEVKDRVFLGAADWLPVLTEAIELRTRARVLASLPEVMKCDDPMCGDGCCDNPECTNVPEEEREASTILVADTVEWL